MKGVSVDDLKELFTLDSETGILYWKKTRQSGVRAGDVAGHITPQGYIRTYVSGKRCMTHRIVWALHTGHWPEDQIDHINGIRSDNRPCNLREASNSSNAKNKGMCVRNTSGKKGVSWVPHLGKWKSEITVDKKRKYLGVYTDINDAAKAYDEAADKLFLEFRRQNE